MTVVVMDAVILLEDYMERIFGYARVSSTGQNLDRQIVELKKYVPEENIVVDKQSGKNLLHPGYMALKGALGLRKGDTLYITSLDRLSRSKKDIKDELQWFHEHGIRLMILDLPTTLIQVPAGQEWILDMVNSIIMEVLSSIAEQEREMIRKRQREGIDAAKARGKHLGRPKLEMPDGFPEIYIKWKRRECTAKRAMEQLGIPSSSFYRMVRKYESSMPKGT